MRAAPLPVPDAVDVLVVGGGPAGCVAARFAALGGARVLVAEQRQQLGVPVACGEYFPRREIGGEAIPAAVVKAPAVKNAVFFEDSATPEAESADNGILVDRAAFDRWLALRAIESSATVRSGLRVVELEAAHAILLSSDGARSRVRFGRLVAADGPCSSVRRLLGMPPLHTVTGVQLEISGAVWPEGVTYFFFDSYPSGYAWVFSKGCSANVGIAGAADGAPALLTRVFDRLRLRQGSPSILRRVGGRIARHEPGAPRRFERILFAGEAAAAIDNVTWGGLWPAVVTGRCAGLWASGAPDTLPCEEAALMHDLRRAAEARSRWEAAGTMTVSKLAEHWYSFHHAPAPAGRTDLS